MKRKASISHDETIIRRLRKDPDFAAEYLKAALEDEDEPRVLLIALRHLAQAQGIAKVAKAAGIERESLYRALSVRGNPLLSTLVAVTKAIGLRLTVEAAQVPRIRGQVPEVQGPLPNPLGLRPGTKRGQLRADFGSSDLIRCAAHRRPSRPDGRLVPFQLIGASLSETAGLHLRIEASRRYSAQIVGTALELAAAIGCAAEGACLQQLVQHRAVIVDGAASGVREALAENCAIPIAATADRNGGVGSVDDCVTGRAARQSYGVAARIVDLHVERDACCIGNCSAGQVHCLRWSLAGDVNNYLARRRNLQGRISAEHQAVEVVRSRRKCKRLPAAHADVAIVPGRKSRIGGVILGGRRRSGANGWRVWKYLWV